MVEPNVRILHCYFREWTIKGENKEIPAFFPIVLPLHPSSCVSSPQGSSFKKETKVNIDLRQPALLVLHQI